MGENSASELLTTGNTRYRTILTTYTKNSKPTKLGSKIKHTQDFKPMKPDPKRKVTTSSCFAQDSKPTKTSFKPKPDPKRKVTTWFERQNKENTFNLLKTMIDIDVPASKLSWI